MLTDRAKMEMDNAAADAQNELVDIPDEALTPVADWFRRWVPKAGYKRLGKIIVQFAGRGDK